MLGQHTLLPRDPCDSRQRRLLTDSLTPALPLRACHPGMQARGWLHTHRWPTPCPEPGLLCKVHGWQLSRIQWGCHAGSIAGMLSVNLDLPSQQTAGIRCSNALLVY
jgi:hypothetical protein